MIFKRATVSEQPALLRIQAAREIRNPGKMIRDLANQILYPDPCCRKPGMIGGGLGMLA